MHCVLHCVLHYVMHCVTHHATARFLTTERVVDVVGGFLRRGEPANAAV